MNASVTFLGVNSRFKGLLMLGIAALLVCRVPIRADMMQISIQSPMMVNAGTVGNGFDVVLTNIKGPSVSVAAFSFEISIASTDVTFNGASTSTVLDPYIFIGECSGNVAHPWPTPPLLYAERFSTKPRP